MHLHPSMVGGGGCGGGRALRRVDSFPARPSLSRSDAMKKKKKNRISKRSRLSAALRELKVAAKARDTNALLQLVLTGHRAGSGSRSGTSSSPSSSGNGGRKTSEAEHSIIADPLGRGGASDGDDIVESGGRPTATATGAGGGARCCGSWTVAALALVVALACVVVLGKAPAICCCTCAAWWYGGGGGGGGGKAAEGRGASDEDSACRRQKDGGGCHGSVTTSVVRRPQAQSRAVEVAGLWVNR